MRLKQLQDGAALTGSGTLSVPSGIFGGYDLNADGTNLATLVVRDGSSGGPIIIDAATITGKPFPAPFKCSGTIHYTVGGAGADAKLYEWVLEKS